MRAYCFWTAIGNAVTATGLGILIFSKKRTLLYNTYVLGCAAVVVWSIFYALWQNTDDPQKALLFCRALMAGAIAIYVFYFHHVLLFLQRKRPVLLAIKYLSGVVFIGASLFTNWIVAGVRPELDFP